MAIAVEELKTEASADVDAQSLRRVLGNAVVFTSKDEARPVLCSVLVEVSDGKISTTATDSYRLGHDEASAQARGYGRFLLDRADVATVVKALKGQKYGTARIAREGSSVIVEGAGWRYAFGAIEGDFPNWQGLIPVECEGLEGPIAFNADYLASFAKVDTDGAPLKMEFKGNGLKPCKISAGSFVGLLMPVRL